MRKFEIVKDEFRKHPDKEIILPTRATINSAGYDFHCPEGILIRPQEIVKIYTDVKVKMWSDDVLMLYVRSSIGIKKNLVLANSTGIIDSDYYSNADNDGNIIIALFNYGTKDVYIEDDERVMQGVFSNYLIIDDENDKKLLKKRNGGIGSTTLIGRIK